MTPHDKIKAAISSEWQPAFSILKSAGLGRTWARHLPQLASQWGWETKEEKIRGSQTRSLYRLRKDTLL